MTPEEAIREARDQQEARRAEVEQSRAELDKAIDAAILRKQEREREIVDHVIPEIDGYCKRFVARGFSVFLSSQQVSVTFRVDGTVPPVVDYVDNEKGVFVIAVFLPERNDPAPCLSFVRGDMPAPVFADWLEEACTNLPAEALNLLRGW